MVAASYGHYGQRAAGIGPDSILPDPTSRIRFSCVFFFFFLKEGVDHIVQNRPGIRSGRPRSGFGQTHLVWKQAVVQESSGPVSGRTQPTRCQFPHFQTRLRSPADLPDSITVQNRPGSALVLADCVRFLGPLKRIRSGTAPASVQEHDDSARFWPKLPSRSGLGANGIRHVLLVQNDARVEDWERWN